MNRPDVRGNQAMIDKVYAFADIGAHLRTAKPSPEVQMSKRQAAQTKRERRMERNRNSVCAYCGAHVASFHTCPQEQL